MTGFAPNLVQPSDAAQDPTKHVNYVLGMVLGVDDLTQEFAYLSQRNQWMVRDLDGYGTIWGLAVTLRDGGARGPEIMVSPGVAANPRGQLIRVAPAQCASLNDWMKPRVTDILARRISTGNPNLFQLPLYLVLSYRTCLTDAVPIAGEPCRSEADSTAPSRVADDFLLELQFDPPPQEEEDAVREFVQWLRGHIAIVPSGPASLTIPQFLDAIRAAAANARQAVSSPPSSPPGGGEFLLDTSPPTVLSVTAALLPDYLRAIGRLWVTELRPMWRPNWLGEKHGCAGTDLFGSPEEGNRVLLAELTLTIGPDGLNSSVWKVQGPVDVNQDARPFLLHLRLLQELMLTQAGGQAAAGDARVVAAGVVNADGSANGRAVLNNLRIRTKSSGASAAMVQLVFDGYQVPTATGGPQYVVKALPWSKVVGLSVFVQDLLPDGINLVVFKSTPFLAGELQSTQVMVEVTQVG